MKEKTRTTVVIESHEQTIIRRSRRTISEPVAPLPAKRLARKHYAWLGAWWKTVALKGVTVFAPWSRRLKTKANERKNRLS